MSRNRGNKSTGRQTGAPGAGRSGSLAGVPGTGRSGRGPREVDLHLPPGHGAVESLERQLARFRGELNSAVRLGEQEIIFIHGSGSGRLREAIRAVIVAEYPWCSSHDASFRKYGYNGATVVRTGK